MGGASRRASFAVRRARQAGGDGRRRAAAILACLLLCVSALAQQQPRNPELAYAYPAGCRQGAEIDIKVGGQALFGAEQAFVSGSGVTATVLGYKRPLTIGEANRLRERLEEAAKKLTGEARSLRGRLTDIGALREAAREAGITDEQLRALDEFRRLRTDPKRQPNPQLEETVRIRLSVASDAAPGLRELRIRTPLGLTNPVRIHIGSLPEVAEVEPNDRLPDSCIGSSMPVVVNGQIMPGDVDRFTFAARKGMRMVIAVSARELVPYLADAVPGWFAAVATVYDADRKEMPVREVRGPGPDPTLLFDVPADGEYTLEIRDSIYRGREDFVYRVAMGELPCVTGVYPPVVRAGATTTVRLTGWNLPSPAVAVRLDEPGVHDLATALGSTASVGPMIRLAVDDLPVVPEKEPNNTGAQSQPITLPSVVYGQIGRPGDADLYAVRGKKGDRLVADVMARRLGSPLDSLVSILDSKGRTIAVNDDYEDKASGLITHHADSYVMATLPADGTYYVRIADTQAGGSAEHSYRMRISAPMPDFELRVTPGSIGMRAGGTVPVTVHALRRDGFDGEIVLALKDAPQGFTLSGGRIPPGLDRVRATLTATPRDPVEPVRLLLEGSATIGGKTVRRLATPAHDMMQAFAYQHLVPAQDWLVAVTGRFWPPPPRVADSDSVVRLPVGGTARIEVPRVGGALAGTVALELSEPPPGVTIESFTMRPGGGVLVLKADGSAKPGARGNLIVNAFITRNAGRAANDRQGQARRVPLGCLPAIPFEIVAR